MKTLLFTLAMPLICVAAVRSAPLEMRPQEVIKALSAGKLTYSVELHDKYNDAEKDLAAIKCILELSLDDGRQPANSVKIQPLEFNIQRDKDYTEIAAPTVKHIQLLGGTGVQWFGYKSENDRIIDVFVALAFITFEGKRSYRTPDNRTIHLLAISNPSATVRYWRGEEAAGQGVLKVNLMRFDSKLKEIGTSKLPDIDDDKFIDPEEIATGEVELQPDSLILQEGKFMQSAIVRSRLRTLSVTVKQIQQ